MLDKLRAAALGKKSTHSAMAVTQEARVQPGACGPFIKLGGTSTRRLVRALTHPRTRRPSDPSARVYTSTGRVSAASGEPFIAHDATAQGADRTLQPISRSVDFLVLGSGIAGLSYALKVAQYGSVAVVCL